MNETAHVLVVDDDPDIRDLIDEYLTEHGYRVSTAEGGAAMRRVLEGDAADLVILDLSMPGEHGFDLAREIRGASNAGIIFLTGSGDPVDRVAGLEIGADDYIAKPCDLRELLARVRSVLRRVGPRAGEPKADEAARIAFDGWRLDLAARRLLSPGGADVALTTAEFDLLSTFAQRPNRVLDRDQLLEILHGREWSPYDRSLDNLVSRLRRKIEADPRRPTLIKTVRGVGYVFTAKTGCG